MKQETLRAAYQRRSFPRYWRRPSRTQSKIPARSAEDPKMTYLPSARSAEEQKNSVFLARVARESPKNSYFKEITRKRKKKQTALTKNAESAAPLHVSPHVSLHLPLHAHLHAPLDAHLHVLRNVFRQRCAEKARERRGNDREPHGKTWDDRV